MAGHAKPRLVVIAGPTGAGKTAVAVALARLLPIEVISADSRQVYRGMDAATGKPTAEERAAVVHHLIDVVDPDDRYQAARFRGDAATLVERIRGRAVRRDGPPPHTGPRGAGEALARACPGVCCRRPQAEDPAAPGPGLRSRAAVAPVDRLP